MNLTAIRCGALRRRPLWAAGWRACVVAGLWCAGSPAWTQQPPGIQERCNVQIGNQVAPVDKRGQWRINNVATTGNRQRARLVCEDVLGTNTGFSELGQIVTNRVTIYKRIAFNGAAPGPTRLAIQGPPGVLGDTTPVQLIVTGTFAGGAAQDLSARDAGTDYRVTDRTVADVDANGLLTPLRSGNVLVTAINEAISASVLVRVAIGPDADGDGIPDDWERAYGLDPHDPTDALTDTDADNLVNVDEYTAGTNPFSKDTDGDGIEDQEELLPAQDGVVTNPLLQDSDADYIPDGVELAVGTHPADADSVDLDASIVRLHARPSLVRLVHSPLRDQPSVMVQVVGELIDGKGVVLTAHPQMRFQVANTAIADMGPAVGQVIGIGPEGDTTLSIALVGTVHAEVVPVEARRFTPSALGVVQLAGCTGSPRMQILAPYVFVACGGAGVKVLEVSQLTGGVAEVATLPTPYPAGALTGDGTTLYVGQADGVLSVDVANPLSPVFHPVVGLLQSPAWMDADDGVLAVAVGQDVQLYALADPAVPVLRGTYSAGTATPVRVDLRGALMAVALQDNTTRLVDVADPTAPVGRALVSGGTTIMALNDTALAFKENFGLRAHAVTNPSAPVAGPTVGANAFVLTDLVGVGTLMLGSDVFRVNSVPIVQVRNPAAPQFAAVVEFSQFGDDNGRTITADGEYLALFTDRNRVLVGRYDIETDTGLFPPRCDWEYPPPGASFISGVRIRPAVTAVDDVKVARVTFLLDGTPVASDISVPFGADVTLPLDTETHTLEAVAYDLAGNAGSCGPRGLFLTPDPGTDLVGRVVGPSGAPAAGVTVSIISHLGQSAVTAADGTFQFVALPSANPFTLQGGGMVEGFVRREDFGPFTSLSGGVLDVGDLLLDRLYGRNAGGPLVSAAVGFSTRNLVPVAHAGVAGPLVSAGVGFSTRVLTPPVHASMAGPVVSSGVGFSTRVLAPTPRAAVAGPVVSAAIGFGTRNLSPPAHATVAGPLVSAPVGFSTPLLQQFLHVAIAGPLVSAAVGFTTTVLEPGAHATVAGPITGAPVAFVTRPVVLSAAPASVSAAGGPVTVTLTGLGFAGASAVTFYRNTTTPETLLTASALTPAGDGKSMTITVTPQSGLTTGTKLVVVTASAGTSYIEDQVGNRLEVVP